MSPKTLNKKTKTPTINTDTFDVDLKFDNGYDDDGEYKRSWVNKDKFPDFEYDYQDAQDNSALNTTSSVEFEIHINLRKVSQNPSQRKEELLPCTPYFQQRRRRSRLQFSAALRG